MSNISTRVRYDLDQLSMFDKTNTDSNKIHNDYKNGIIKSQNEYIKIMDKLDSDYLNSIENSNMYKCEIANCYKSVKQYLDYLSDKNNYKKKNKYSIEDYINIIKINKNNNLIV